MRNKYTNIFFYLTLIYILGKYQRRFGTGTQSVAETVTVATWGWATEAEVTANPNVE